MQKCAHVCMYASFYPQTRFNGITLRMTHPPIPGVGSEGTDPKNRVQPSRALIGHFSEHNFPKCLSNAQPATRPATINLHREPSTEQGDLSSGTDPAIRNRGSITNSNPCLDTNGEWKNWVGSE